MSIKNIETNLKLENEEKIIFSSTEVVVTDLRVLVKPRIKKNFDTSIDVNGWNYINTNDCALPKPKNSGKETRKETAHKFTGIGFVLLFIQVLPYLLFNLNIIDLFGPLSGFLEAIYFLVTMMLLTAGLYFLIISYIYSRPHTALLFVSIKERKKKLVAIFPGWDSVEAQQVVSAINRVHRRI